MHLKVVETIENSIRKELQRSNPFKENKCKREDCKICQIETGVNCRTRGCVYEIQCEECKRRYRGQTGNSANERINQHFDEWERMIDTCPLYRHSELYQSSRKYISCKNQDIENLFWWSHPTTDNRISSDRWIISKRNDER